MNTRKTVLLVGAIALAVWFGAAQLQHHRQPAASPKACVEEALQHLLNDCALPKDAVVEPKESLVGLIGAKYWLKAVPHPGIAISPIETSDGEMRVNIKFTSSETEGGEGVYISHYIFFLQPDSRWPHGWHITRIRVIWQVSDPETKTAPQKKRGETGSV